MIFAAYQKVMLKETGGLKYDVRQLRNKVDKIEKLLERLLACRTGGGGANNVIDQPEGGLNTQHVRWHTMLPFPGNDELLATEPLLLEDAKMDSLVS
jgi:hypothetical protein